MGGVTTPNALLPLSVKTAQPFSAFQASQRTGIQNRLLEANTSEIQRRGQAADASAGIAEDERLKQVEIVEKFRNVEAGVKQLSPLLDQVLANKADPQQFMAALEERRSQLITDKRPTEDTDMAIQTAQSGNFAGVRQLFDQVLENGRRLDAADLGLGEQLRGADAPSSVREFTEFESLGDPNNPNVLTPAQERFLQVKRASGQVIDIEGAPNLVNRETGITTPLSTRAAEIDAASDRAGAVESSKQEAQIAAISDKVSEQYKAEFKADAPKRIRAANDQIARVDSVMEEAQLGLEDVSFTTTGLLGAVNRKVAGTTAFALARKIDTLQANLSFDRIAEMRKNSPTGGALGQVSERELSLLGASVVALDQANNETEVRRAFTKVLFHYNNWKSVVTGQKDADILLTEGDLSGTSEQTDGNTAPDGTVITNSEGQSLTKQNGQWVPNG